MRLWIQHRELRVLPLGLLLIALIPFACASAEEKIVVAAASDLVAPLGVISTEYERTTGYKVVVVSGASGNLSAQIMNGAPFDVFMSADMDYPRSLIANGKADASTLFRYASGKLVLVCGRQVLSCTGDIRAALLDPKVTKVAIANPRHAPYGRAAVEALKHLGVYDQVSHKLVIAENVSQASQFVESGNAQIGLVALSRALAPEARDRTRHLEVPANAYDRIQQGAVVLNRGKTSKAAQAFMLYIKTPDAANILRRYGFDPSDGLVPAERHSRN